MQQGDYSELIEKAKALMAKDVDIDSILLFLKNNGCSIIPSILILRSIVDIGLRDAKATVCLSKAWNPTLQPE